MLKCYQGDVDASCQRECFQNDVRSILPGTARLLIDVALGTFGADTSEKNGLACPLRVGPSLRGALSLDPVTHDNDTHEKP